MNLIAFITKNFVFAGLSRAEFRRIKANVAESNRRSVKIFAGIVGITVLALLLLSYIFPVLRSSATSYIVCAAACLVIYLLASGPAKGRPLLIYGLVYTFLFMILGLGIALGTLVEPHQASISFCVLMFAAPLLFSDAPVHLILLTIISIITYTFAANATQDETMFIFNQSAVLPYGAICLVVSTFLMRLKFNMFLLQDKTEMMDKIKALNSEIIEAKDKQSETLGIIQYLATTYKALYYIDIEKGTFQELGKTALQYVEDVIGQSGDAQEQLDAFVNNFVVPELRDEYIQFVQLDQVCEQLKGENVISKTYKGILTGWSEGTFIAGDRGDNGYCKWILWGSRDLNEQKQIELRQQAELERHYAVIRATSQRYYCAYSIDVGRDRFTEVFSQPHLTEALGSEGVASKSLEKAWRMLVNAEDQPLMQAFHDMNRWKTYLQHHDIDSCEYRGVINGWSRAIIFAAKRDENGMVTHVVYTLETIHEQKETEQALQDANESLRKLSEQQQSQIDEIQTLNNELEERQAQLKEITAEQKAHLEEIQLLKQEAEAANQAKTSFLFNMSHDIRTPMNAIIGFTNLLRKHQEKPERREDYLDKIENSSNVLLSIINNVLEMARIEKGTVSIADEYTGVETFNETLIAIFNELMEQKGITFVHDVEVQHHHVMCDTTKLRELFYNILSNAYKYTNEGGTVSMILEEQPSTRAGYALFRTTIADTGIGMSEEFLPHLFEEFSRENNTTDNKIEGTGLGMPIVKRLVELMEGTIEVTSKKGVGTTFVVTLPHKIADDVKGETDTHAAYDPAKFEGKRILLAEDNDLNAEIATEILTEAGFTLERADDGAQCVQMIVQAEPGYYDLILMDVQMPRMNGYEATHAIRALSDPAKARIPILAMTANAFEEDIRSSMAAGMNGHLTKPIDVDILMKTLAAHIA